MDRQGKYIPYIARTHKVLNSCRSKIATRAHDVCDVQGASSYIYIYIQGFFYSYIYRIFSKICLFPPPTHLALHHHIFILHFDAQAMLTLILIDVQYSQNAVFSFEKGSNRQIHSSSGSHHPVKEFPQQCSLLFDTKSGNPLSFR